MADQNMQQRHIRVSPWTVILIIGAGVLAATMDIPGTMGMVVQALRTSTEQLPCRQDSWDATLLALPSCLHRVSGQYYHQVVHPAVTELAAQVLQRVVGPARAEIPLLVSHARSSGQAMADAMYHGAAVFQALCRIIVIVHAFPAARFGNVSAAIGLCLGPVFVLRMAHVLTVGLLRLAMHLILALWVLITMLGATAAGALRR